LKPAALVRPDRMLTLSTRKLVTVKRPDGTPATKATMSKDGSLLVVRFSFRHE
jgi:hypothetical protein